MVLRHTLKNGFGFKNLRKYLENSQSGSGFSYKKMTVKNQLKIPRFGERLVVLSFDIIRKNFSTLEEIRLIFFVTATTTVGLQKTMQFLVVSRRDLHKLTQSASWTKKVKSP